MKNDDDDNDYEKDNMKKIKLIKTNSGAWKLVKTLGNWRQGNKTLKKNDKKCKLRIESNVKKMSF